MVAVALAGTLLASGCGTPQPDTAAIVGDVRISESEIGVAVEQLNAAKVSQNPLTSSIVLPYLILEPVVTDLNTSAGGADASDAARQFLKSQGVAEPADASVRVMTAATLVQQILGAGGPMAEKLAQAVKDTPVTVNPRYGTFDPDNPLRLNAQIAPWLVPSAAQ